MELEYAETCACGRVLTLADHASSSPNTCAKCRKAGDQAWADEAEAERRELTKGSHERQTI